MEYLAPAGSVYQAGTLSGNPVALAAGIATLKTLRNENPYPEMKRLGKVFADKANKILGEEAHCVVYGEFSQSSFLPENRCEIWQMFKVVTLNVLPGIIEKCLITAYICRLHNLN